MAIERIGTNNVADKAISAQETSIVQSEVDASTPCSFDLRAVCNTGVANGRLARSADVNSQI